MLGYYAQGKSIVGEVKGHNQGRADSQIHLVTWHLIFTETSNFVHILIYEKQHQI